MWAHAAYQEFSFIWFYEPAMKLMPYYVAQTMPYCAWSNICCLIENEHGLNIDKSYPLQIFAVKETA